MSYINDMIADRFRDESFDIAKEDYKFIKIKRAKEDIKRRYPNVKLIDLGIGEPDLPADPRIVKLLCQEAGKSENRWYADNGIPEFQQAAAEYLNKVFGVKDIDPHNEILHGIGAKSILSMLPLCLINPGDITITTLPSYPIISTHTKYLGGVVYGLPLTRANNFYPDFSNIPNIILYRSKILYINYPNNPTGQIPTEDFYKRVIDFAYKNNIIVVADSSYAALTFDGIKPLSFLSIDGAKEVGVEIHSLSKAFNMTGWRIAFVAGNSDVINIYGKVKANSDSGQFRAIQKSGIYALKHPEITEKNCIKYSRRFDLLIDVLREVGFKAQKPKATFYCYVPIPRGTRSGIVFKDAEDFSLFLLKNAFICTVPWNDPEPYIRLSVTFEAKDYNEEKIIIDELKKRLMDLELVF
ncbi:LL-diaminopimelate aminotransferase [Paramaledivibacter caminithermalis]|uniref:Aminotransferase n=1 Tax=Paramaledivibacter caminithermalis (strain DSM 15212 / CIP 107654 / DViRD3) TaxID=1121301 RepID=A0A1M6PVN0_PARC5|nr:LL-diaminopimelate aminotransferase [Paramaledivibacter caminithermalis]SHK11981.1 LL-diaminopimelate aminotransferase apoenzyme [Paramaledivibacter caminithermalis DSM 15212]